jgi:hypothetical protein
MSLRCYGSWFLLVDGSPVGPLQVAVLMTTGPGVTPPGGVQVARIDLGGACTARK